jgi:capsular exopolysaccharide synthesis family protein
VPPDNVARLGPTFQEESYRVLRSNLMVSLDGPERATVLVTSAYTGEGKTATAFNLACSLGAAGQRVVLVDLDLRSPNIHEWVGLDNDVGVSDVLLGRRTAEECLEYVEIAGADWSHRLYVLRAGATVDNPTELLGSRRTAALLQSLTSQADVVIIDTAPVLQVADTLVIGRMTAGALLVVESRRTPIGAVQHAKDALIRSQTRLLGVVLNKVRARDAGPSGYGAGYGYGYGEKPSGNGSTTTSRTRGSTA